MAGYLAFIHAPEATSGWGVTFPDVSGCVSVGDTFEDAVDAAGEALSGHLAALAADGDPIPRPRSWTEISADPVVMEDAEGALIQIIVPHPISDGQVHIDIVVDRALLHRADAAAEARGMTRAAYIEAALSSAAEA